MYRYDKYFVGNTDRFKITTHFNKTEKIYSWFNYETTEQNGEYEAAMDSAKHS